MGANGEVLTTRAVAVIIYPGVPLTVEGGYAQTRTNAASPGNPKDYLDRVSLPLGCSASCTGTYDNAGLSNTFIQVAPGTRYPRNAEDSTKSGVVPFNDQLSYVTIDELMPYIEQRVLREIKTALLTYKTTAATPPGELGYPWAATYASPVNDSVFISNPGELVGMFPFFPIWPTTNTPIGFATNFNWSVTSFSALSRDCRLARTVPNNRWININQNMLTQIGTSGSATGTSSWVGTAANNYNALKFTGNFAFPTAARIFTAYSTAARCNTNGTTSGTLTYDVTRSLSFAVDVPESGSGRCTGAFTRTYTQGSSSQYQTTNWSCSSMSVVTSFAVTANDTIAFPIAISAATGLTIAPPVAVTGLRYQPLMPSWYFDEGWFQQAFYARARSFAPTTLAGCGTATTLTVGSNASVNSVLLLSGQSLTGAIRPSLPPTDYLESANQTATTNCAFAAPTTKPTATYNDQTLIVAP